MMMNRLRKAGLMSSAAAVVLMGCNLSEPFRVLDEERIVARVSVTPQTVAAKPGDTIQVNASPLGPGNRVITEAEVVWSSGDQSIARSLGNGRFVVIALGDAQLFATSRGRRGVAQLLVSPSTP